MKKKKKEKDEKQSLSKLETEVAKFNPDFVKWLQSKKGKGGKAKEEK